MFLGLGLSTPIESENKSDMHVIFSFMLVENSLLISGGSNGVPGMRAPSRSKFFHFHAVFGKQLAK